MTTFTLQDLNQMPVTTEEEEAMQDLTKQQVENTSTNDTIIQGATGAQYEAIDFKKFEAPEGGVIQHAPIPQPTPDIQALIQTLSTTFNQLLSAITAQAQDKQPVSSSSGGDADLIKAVEVVLEDADWMMEKLEDAMDNRYDMEDLISQGVADKVSGEVDNYFSYNFSIEDHCDIADLVEDRVESVIDGIVEEKLAEIIQDKLSSATITFS